MQLPLLKDVSVRGKAVFLRADLDVPLSQLATIEDDTRLKSALPTIEYLLKQNAKVIIGGHLGRPIGLNHEARIMNHELSLRPVAEWFAKRFHDSQFMIHDSKLGKFEGWEIGPNIFLLENLRFFEGEEKNDPEFGKKLASLAEIYVNDAFAMCHRNHASIVGITKFLPHFAGFHLEQEVSHLTHAMENPKRPLVVIVGGKKIETKLPLVEKMHHISDYVLVGGKIAKESTDLVKVAHEKISGKKAILLVAQLNEEGIDITDTDAENFLQIISLAKTIIWNGSMGIIGGKSEHLVSESGTRKIAEGILKTNAYTIVGGGDTVEFLNKMGILSKFSFASTGGGAMLAFLSGEKLPGLEALKT